MKRLLGVAAFSGLLTLLRMGMGFLIAKLVAVYAGPSGIGLLGQLQSLTLALNGVVSAPAGNGVVRYTAEHHKNGFISCAPWWRASLRWLLWFVVATMVAICLAAKPLAVYLFGDRSLFWLVIVAAVTLPLSAANALLTSVTNGLEQYRRYIGLGMLAVVLSSTLMVSLTISMKLEGALLAAVLFSAVSGSVFIVSSIRQPWFRFKYWWGVIERQKMNDVAGYIVMAATSAVCVPASTILVRNILVGYVGWGEAGNWNAVYKISEAYLGIITVALATYYLPRLAAVQDGAAIRKETFSAAAICLPVVSSLALMVFLCRDFAISLLFTEDFRGARDLFGVQLVGDVFKILGWIFAYPMLARGATKWYVAIEIGFALFFVAAGYVLIPKYGTQGANLAFTLTYMVYFVFVAFNLNRFAGSPRSSDTGSN